MSDEKYIFTVPHKCGSVVSRKVLQSFSTRVINKEKHTEFQLASSSKKVDCLWTRHVRFSSEQNDDNFFIFIPRHPVAICISAFYSVGYTHPCPPNQTIEEREALQKSVRDTGLLKYVDNRIEEKCNVIETIITHPSRNKLILPYELMISDFSTFLKTLLDFLDMQELHNDVYNQNIKHFLPVKDLSSQITSNNLKTHKRTTDIYEWKKKIPEDVIQKYLSRYPIIRKYLDILDVYK